MRRAPLAIVLATFTAPALADPVDPPESSYAYSPVAKRDPFVNVLEAYPGDPPPVRTPLQRFTLDQLTLTSVLARGGTGFAMVEDPTGRGHTVTRGTIIGPMGGRISRITKECITIQQDYRDYTGRKVVTETEKCFPPLEVAID